MLMCSVCFCFKQKTADEMRISVCSSDVCSADLGGMIKAVLMLRHQAVPPSLHFTEMNPHIDLGGADFRVPTARTEMPLSHVGVSSFGFSEIGRASCRERVFQLVEI